ncbi:puromycin-sensitive aminopeptidase-like protein [Bemisia tabaci]|uniref:puromycin-sensitive aminopeptidase-like protein n=1 Tax=Bemisia tabaci TaxID=7038 RepID=UPI003B28C05A
MAEKKPFERLPKTVKPSHYELFLHPDLKTLTFDGKETVKIEILSAVNKIVLHAADLSIKDAVLTLANGETVTSEVSLTPEDELATFSFPKMLPPGPASLSCSFVGELNDKMKGFYRSKYISSATKEETYAAVTQFEATDARRCFPCWDEPAVKAIFSITLCVQPNRVALSNMVSIEQGFTAHNADKVFFYFLAYERLGLTPLPLPSFVRLRKTSLNSPPLPQVPYAILERPLISFQLINLIKM